jgi:hypothetical protein
MRQISEWNPDYELWMTNYRFLLDIDPLPRIVYPDAKPFMVINNEGKSVVDVLSKAHQQTSIKIQIFNAGDYIIGNEIRSVC